MFVGVGKCREDSKIQDTGWGVGGKGGGRKGGLRAEPPAFIYFYNFLMQITHF